VIYDQSLYHFSSCVLWSCSEKNDKMAPDGRNEDTVPVLGKGALLSTFTRCPPLSVTLLLLLLLLDVSTHTNSDTMKLSLLLLLPATASAFVPAQSSGFMASPSLNAAKTFEEDLELTREVISKFMESHGDNPVEPPGPKKEESAKEE
jgi:hypothetical protein